MSVGTGSVGSAGVKNLRAMFENKSNDQSTSPPSRERSPNGSVSSQASRQVSKVRTSFVAVDRPGESSQSPQRTFRKISDVSSMAEVREEAIAEDSNISVVKAVAQDAPRSVVEEKGLGAILKGSPFETSPSPPVEPPTNSSREELNVEPSESPEESKATETGIASNVASPARNIQSADQSPAKTESIQDTSPSEPVPTALNTEFTTSTSTSKESPTLSKKSPVTQKKEPPAIVNGHGSMIKPRGGVNKITGIIQSGNRAREGGARGDCLDSQPAHVEKKKSTKEVKVPSVASKPTAASRAHAYKQDKHSAGQERIKSPTTARPVKLPSAATAGTAASAARKGGTKADDEGKTATSEKKTKAAQVPRVANVATRASLAKKSSRASLANGEDTPRTRLSAAHKQADESFLARMTRPTASSARRAQETAQMGSPPRLRQSSANHEAARRVGRKSSSASMKPAPVPDEANETTLEPVNENVSVAPPNGATELVEGEPGPSEEEILVNYPQPAEAESTTL